MSALQNEQSLSVEEHPVEEDCGEWKREHEVRQFCANTSLSTYTFILLIEYSW